jgi:nucleoside-diphosphate-sugar epimerase
MIIGSGFLAQAFLEFNKDDKVIIYSSGVSNSTETRSSEYLRESKLLTETIQSFPDKKIIYFSTISLFDPSLTESLYIKHKAGMELILKNRHKNYLILRLPNIVGYSDNPNTLTNYLFHQIKNGISFVLYNKAYRYLMDIDEVVKLCSYLIRNQVHSSLFNISHNAPISLIDLVDQFEKILDKKAIYTIQEKGAFYSVPEEITTLPLNDMGIVFTKNYYAGLIQKYYAKR